MTEPMTSAPAAVAKKRVYGVFPNSPIGRVKHGHTDRSLPGRTTPTYRSWRSMLARCEGKYAALGITVCERWTAFENFLADMGERPAGKTLDRWPDNTGNYEPGNCRWAGPIDQSRNRRSAKLTLSSATEIAIRRLRGEAPSVVAREYNITSAMVRLIVTGAVWKDALAAAKEIIGND